MRKNQKADIRKPEILEHFYRVVMQEGLEGASIGKIANSMNIHPSLIIHYFKTKDNLMLALTDLIVEKYQAPHFLQRFDEIDDPEQRFEAFLDTMFQESWVKTVSNRVFYAFYYLAHRKPEIRVRFVKMFSGFRNYVLAELDFFKKQGIVKTVDLEMAADFIVTMIEGAAFHGAFLGEGKPFEGFGKYAKKITKDLLTHGDG